MAGSVYQRNDKCGKIYKTCKICLDNRQTEMNIRFINIWPAKWVFHEQYKKSVWLKNQYLLVKSLPLIIRHLHSASFSPTYPILNKTRNFEPSSYLNVEVIFTLNDHNLWHVHATMTTPSNESHHLRWRRLIYVRIYIQEWSIPEEPVS